MFTEKRVPEELEDIQSVDVINFALLAFLSDKKCTAKELRDLLEEFTGAELSRTPFYRRMRGLVDGGYVEEERVDYLGTMLYSLTEEGKKFCLIWAGRLQVLVSLAFYMERMEV